MNKTISLIAIVLCGATLLGVVIAADEPAGQTQVVIADQYKDLSLIHISEPTRLC